MLILVVRNNPPLLPASLEKIGRAIARFQRVEPDHVLHVERCDGSREITFVIRLKGVNDLDTLPFLRGELQDFISAMHFGEEVHAELRSRMPTALAERFRAEAQRAEARPRPPIFDDIGDDLVPP